MARLVAANTESGWLFGEPPDRSRRDEPPERERPLAIDGLIAEVEAFDGFGTKTRASTTGIELGGTTCEVPTYTNEFWTSRQRAACSLHEVSYRACFKPQLPDFFIRALTRPGQTVLDPFMGRGTTMLAAALCGRVGLGQDSNPVARALIEPRLDPPTLDAVRSRLEQIPWQQRRSSDDTPDPEYGDGLLTFFHRETFAEIRILRDHLAAGRASGARDGIDAWIEMVALNRLTGHSVGYFSVYSLPPNQATTIAGQRAINARRMQTPPRRDVPALILRKSHRLLAGLSAAERQALSATRAKHQLVIGDSTRPSPFAAATVDLVVTSPPFLDVVDYDGDNWLRAWFLGLPSAQTRAVSILRDLPAWEEAMSSALAALAPALTCDAVVAFEVGEVRKGSVRLELAAARAAIRSGFDVVAILINAQDFTKTAQVWGVDNNRKGTNSNRIVLCRLRTP